MPLHCSGFKSTVSHDGSLKCRTEHFKCKFHTCMERSLLDTVCLKTRRSLAMKFIEAEKGL